MKTSALLIRVAICFFLSLVPLNDLENRIYSARLEYRGISESAANPIIIQIYADQVATSLERILAQQPRLILVTW